MPGAGLNLTRATLDATLKYPWVGPESDGGARTQALGDQAQGASAPGAGAPGARAPGKYGCYAEDAAIFEWIRAGAPHDRPCLEAQVMDWADDVAYSVHDLEDGLHAGLVTLDKLRDPAEQQAVASLTLSAYCKPGSASLAELTEAFAGLIELDCWPRDFDGSRASSAAVKHLTSELIGTTLRGRRARDPAARSAAARQVRG